MMSLWLALGGLLLLAIVFMVWPLWRYHTAAKTSALGASEMNLRLAENVRIFREHLAELESSRAAQAIDAEQFSQLKLELERNLLNDEASLRAQQTQSSQSMGAKLVVAFCVVLLLAGIAFYKIHGSAADVAIQVLEDAKNQQDYQDMVQNRDPDPSRAKELLVEIQHRLKDKPDSLQYWYLLARTQLELGDYAQAAESYRQILKRDPQSPVIMAELAQAMFLADGNKMSPPIVDLAKSALTLDPKNTMALGLLGIDAYARKDYRQTIRYWQESINLLGPGSQGAQALASGIERARQAYVAEGGKLEDLTVKSPYALHVKVSLGPKVKVNPDLVVFVYARAWKGSPMPLAIRRIKVADLPQTVTLDETMAMSPTASLATASDVEVVARVSPEGSAQAKAGDWQASQGPISMKSIPEQLQLEINTQLTAETLNPR